MGDARVNRVRIWIARLLLPAGWDLVRPMTSEMMDAMLRQGYEEMAAEDLAIADSNLGAYEDWPRDD